MIPSQRQSEGLRKDYERMERDRAVKHALLIADGHGIHHPPKSGPNGISISDSNRKRYQFKNSTIVGCDYSRGTLQDLIFDGTKFIRCNFSRSVLCGCEFINVEFIDCDFIRCKKTNTKFYNCKKKNCIGLNKLFFNIK